MKSMCCDSPVSLIFVTKRMPEYSGKQVGGRIGKQREKNVFRL